MPVHWREGLKGKYAVMVYSDPYSLPEMRRAAAEIFAHPISAPPFRLLVDRRHCTAPEPVMVRSIIGFFAQHRAQLDGARVALVVKTDLAYGMARMAELTSDAEGLPANVQVFREWSEAERWLAEDVDAALPG